MKNFVTALILSFSLLYAVEAEPSFEIKDINNKTYTIQGEVEGISLKGYEGKILLFEFFGHQCPPCLASIPNLIKLQEEFKDDIVLFSIEVQGLTQKELKTFATNKGINYIIVAQENAIELTNYVAQRSEWNGGIPFTIGLDTKNIVRFIEAGMIPEDYLRLFIETFKAKK